MTSSLQWTFMFCSVLALLLLPMINHTIHLNNLIHTSIDPNEKKVIHDRLQQLRYALLTIWIAILLLTLFVPFEFANPGTILTPFVYTSVSILLATSITIFVLDVSKSIYTPKNSSSVQFNDLVSIIP